MLLDYQVGAIAMARGSVGDAQAWYARGQRALRIDSRNDRGPALIVGVAPGSVVNRVLANGYVYRRAARTQADQQRRRR